MVFQRILPREPFFFDLFEKHAGLTCEGARLFQDLVDHLTTPGAKAKRIKEVEHEADVITHRTVERLHRTFITPIDRDDIHRLISRMDDIMDAIDAASERLWLYEITESTDTARELARILTSATTALRDAVSGLRNLKMAKGVLACCVEVNRLENEGDALFRTGLARLFKEGAADPLWVMKWKEIYEMLEHAIDRCEDVANIVEGILLESG